MSFIKHLKRKSTLVETSEESFIETEILIEKTVNEAEKEPVKLLRKAGFKIRLVTPTSFGTQIDFSKVYEEEEIKKALIDFNIKIKNKAVFIVE